MICDVTWRKNYVIFSNVGHLGSAILEFLIFPEPLKIAKIDQNLIKTDK